MKRKVMIAALSAAMATGFSLEMNRLHPVENGITPEGLLIAREGSFARNVSVPVRVASKNAIQVPASSAGICGHFVVLGCFRKRSSAQRQLTRLGGLSAG